MNEIMCVKYILMRLTLSLILYSGDVLCLQIELPKTKQNNIGGLCILSSIIISFMNISITQNSVQLHIT